MASIIISVQRKSKLFHFSKYYLKSVLFSRYDVQRNKWIEIASMSARRYGLSVSVLNGYLYAIGGNDGTGSAYSSRLVYIRIDSLNTVERYNPASNQWHPIAAMDTRRAYASSTVYNGCLHVAGGADKHTPLASVERYDPTMNMWMNDVTAMNNCRWGVRLDSTIYSNYSLSVWIGRRQRSIICDWW